MLTFWHFFHRGYKTDACISVWKLLFFLFTNDQSCDPHFATKYVAFKKIKLTLTLFVLAAPSKY